MRLLFIVRPFLAGRAAAHYDGEQDGGRAKRKSKPESHGVKLNEPAGPCNRGLRADARTGASAKTGLEICRRAAQVNGRARVAEWQTRQT